MVSCSISLDLPPPPTNIEATQYELKTFLLSWSPSFSPYSVPVTYQVEISSDVGNTVVITTNLMSHLFTSQVRSCSLQVRVSSINAAGESSYSEVITISSILCELEYHVCLSGCQPILKHAVNNSEEVSRSLKHELEYLADGLLMTISFAVSCQAC